MSKGDFGESSLYYYGEEHERILLQYLASRLSELTWQEVTIVIETPCVFLVSTPTEILARIGYVVDQLEIIERVTVRTDLLAIHRQLFYDSLHVPKVSFERLRPYLDPTR